MTRTKEGRQVLSLYVLTDALLCWAALTCATMFRLNTIHQVDPVLLQRDRLVCLGIFLIVGFATGLYRPATIRDRFDSLYFLLITVLAAAITQFTMASLLPLDIRVISRREMLIALVLAGFLMGTWHIFAVRLIGCFRSLRRFFYVIGDPIEGRRIAREIPKNERFAGARYVSIESLVETVRHRERHAEYEDLATSDAIVALREHEHMQLNELLQFCDQHFSRTYIYPNLSDMLVFQHGNLLGIAGIPLVQVGSLELATSYLFVKRVLDFIIAALGIILISPLGIATAIAVKLNSPGPIFYLQERLGLNGVPFQIIKFRSMHVNDDTGSDYARAEKEDSRVTSVGRFIRKHKIDELPQLINVLKGDMSLIGPRPLWRDFFQQHGEESPLWERRLAVRPGLTCLSHILGGSFSKAGDFLRYDLVYISTLSFMVDLRILFATIRIVLSGKGA